MSSTNLHLGPFDDATKQKLLVFEQYLKSWLPVFFHHPGVTTINIYDFFCGPGKDCTNCPGSPILALKTIKTLQNQNIHNIPIYLHCFDDDQEKIKHLNDYKKSITLPKNTHIDIDCSPFETSFPSSYTHMSTRGNANFLFIDPHGIYGDLQTFLQIQNLRLTDFLLFLPLTFINRFANEKSFQSRYPGLNFPRPYSSSKFAKTMCYYFEQHITAGKEYHLAPFSIQKQNSPTMCGLIFGSNHIRGLDKFLHTCWDIDKNNGEANFGLKGDLPQCDQFTLDFIEPSNKKRNFENFLTGEILSGRVTDKKSLYCLTLKKGMLPKHARKVLQFLYKNGQIVNKPTLSYGTSYKPKKIDKIILADAYTK